MKLLIVGLAWAAYYGLHSLLAANSVKRFFHHNLISKNWYRLVFNIFSIVLTLPLVIQFFLVEQKMLLPFGWLKYVGAGVAIAGAIWLYRAMGNYDTGEFLGFAQMRNQQKNEANQLVVRGLNAKVRHPLYFGTLLVLLGVFLFTPTDVALVILCISVLYLIIGSKLEERKLEQQFGEAYRSYQREVPMLIPFPWKRRRK